jgi:hypothetical protein
MHCLMRHFKVNDVARFWKFRAILAATLTCASCGPESNILGLTVPKSHKTSYAASLAGARAAYDRGDMELSLALATEAYQQNPRSEQAAIVFGYANLGVAGLEPFRLASIMAGDSETSSAEKSDSTSSQSPTENANPSDTKSASGSNSILTSLSTVLGLTANDFAQLGDIDDTDPELPLQIPKCAEDARKNLRILNLVNDALVAICPFIDPGAYVTGELRHSCESLVERGHQRGKAHFLWALSHLTEAMIFNAVLNVSNDGSGGKSNLERRVEKLQQTKVTSATDVTEFINKLNAFQKTVGQMLPLGTCSEAAPTTQLRATLNDMLATAAAFRLMPGLPPSISASLEKSVASFAAKGADAADLTTKLASLRGDLTRSLTTKLSSKIDAIQSTADLSPNQKEELCSAFNSISGGGSKSSSDAAADSGTKAPAAPKICL